MVKKMELTTEKIFLNFFSTFTDPAYIRTVILGYRKK